MAHDSDSPPTTFLKDLRAEVDLSPGAKAFAGVVESADALAEYMGALPAPTGCLRFSIAPSPAGLLRLGELANSLCLFACECARSVVNGAWCSPTIAVAGPQVRAVASKTLARPAVPPGPARAARRRSVARYIPAAGVQLAAYCTTYLNAVAAAVQGSQFAAFAVVCRAGEGGVKRRCSAMA